MASSLQFARWVFDLTRYLRLVTRFTDEIFAVLIVSIFIIDAIGNPSSDVGILRLLYPKHKLDDDAETDTEYRHLTIGLLSVIIGCGTTSLIFFFRSFKDSAFFCNDNVRISIHDFAVTSSVCIWTLIKHLLFDDIEVPTLHVPDKFEPSFACCDSSCKTSFPDDCPNQPAAVGARSWMVDFGDLNGKSWVPIMAAGPAVFAFVLIYLDNGLTWHLIHHKSHKLQ